MDRMRFFIVDDDLAIRSMIAEIIEDNDLGEVAGEADNGSLITPDYLYMKKVDILVIDLLMPIRDGLHTVREVAPQFDGKIIMISQVENKEMIGEAYALGVEYYITKPINRLEVIGVFQNVVEHVQLQKSIRHIQKTLNILGTNPQKERREQPQSDKNIVSAGRFLLAELGIAGESGSRDLLDMLSCMYRLETSQNLENDSPALKDIFDSVAVSKLGSTAKPEDLKKEIKASEQRVRRAIWQALNHLASLGLTDYGNPKFEDYASNFYNFTEIRKRMLELQQGVDPSQSQITINTKKFVKVLYLEARKRM